MRIDYDSDLRTIYVEVRMDTQALATVTVPYDDVFAVLSNNHTWTVREYKKGEIVTDFKIFMNKHCPGFHVIKSRLGVIYEN